MLTITIFAAVACGLIFLALSIGISYLRITRRVSLGDGGDYLLGRTIRAHANWAEFVPISLILLWLAETTQANHVVLWVAAAMLVVGRFLHAWGLVTKRLTKRRQLGALLNYVVIAYLAVVLIISMT